MSKLVTAIVEREGDGYVALCPEVDVASQGQNVAEARKNLKKALELFSKPHHKKKSNGDLNRNST